jgi:hypothetical protein
MRTSRDNARFLREVKHAHFLWPVLGNQPGLNAALNAALNALPWETTPVAAATCEISRGRIETRTIRVLPAPAGTGFADARQALLIERCTTFKSKGHWRTRCEAVLYITSLDAGDTTPEDLLAHVRGHWRVEHAHWLRSPGALSLSHDVAPERSAESFCNTSRGCGARCCRCSEARPAWTCHMHDNPPGRRRVDDAATTCTVR